MRLLDELSAHSAACMVTLTYNEKNNPLALVKSDLQKFIKRVRKHFSPQKYVILVVVSMAEKSSRPHYHVILFGVSFSDRYVFLVAQVALLIVAQRLKVFGNSVFLLLLTLHLKVANMLLNICRKLTTPADSAAVRFNVEKSLR